MKFDANYKSLKYAHVKTTLFILVISLFFARGCGFIGNIGETVYHISLNGHNVGTLKGDSDVEKLLLQARKNVASATDELMFMETELVIDEKKALWGDVDTEEDVLLRMESVVAEAVQESTLHRAYTMKINEYIINVPKLDDVRQILQTAVSKYDPENQFKVELVLDNLREFNVLTTNIVEQVEEEPATMHGTNFEAGIQSFMSGLTGEVEEEPKDEMGFEDFDLGISDIDFVEEVEVVEVYLPSSQLTGLEEAIEKVTKEQESAAIYEVKTGDTLYEIAINLNITIDKIVEMNSNLLKNSESTLHVGDKLYITIPEPELSVKRTQTQYYEEIYDAEVQYIDNDEWYTTKQEVRQQPSSGFRKVVVEESYVNDDEVTRTILKEEVLKEAVAKIVERGTKVPPTYIRPLTGGRLTSKFGYRNRPTAGASSNHAGVDLATPTGTTIKASSGGKVTHAGWASGYGYLVTIKHPDGNETRYGHLSKVLVSVGQTVKQGQTIAKSGNTGISTGPHLHFEIRVNGTPVDPFKYIK